MQKQRLGVWISLWINWGYCAKTTTRVGVWVFLFCGVFVDIQFEEKIYYKIFFSLKLLLLYHVFFSVASIFSSHFHTHKLACLFGGDFSKG